MNAPRRALREHPVSAPAARSRGARAVSLMGFLPALLFATGFSVGFGTESAPAAPGVAARDPLRDAREARAAGDTDSAREILERHLRAHPGDTDALRAASDLAWSQGDTDAALAHAEAAAATGRLGRFDPARYHLERRRSRGRIDVGGWLARSERYAVREWDAAISTRVLGRATARAGITARERSYDGGGRFRDRLVNGGATVPVGERTALAFDGAIGRGNVILPHDVASLFLARGLDLDLGLPIESSLGFVRKGYRTGPIGTVVASSTVSITDALALGVRADILVTQGPHAAAGAWVAWAPFAWLSARLGGSAGRTVEGPGRTDDFREGNARVEIATWSRFALGAEASLYAGRDRRERRVGVTTACHF